MKYRHSGKACGFLCRKPILLLKEANNISNAINPCSNKWADGIEQKQLNTVLEVFSMSDLDGRPKN